MNGTSGASLNLLENIEFLNEDLKSVFLKAPAESPQLHFPLSDGPLFMTLLLRNLNDLLNSNVYSVALIKEEIGQLKEDLELINSFFGKVEQEWNRDLWARKCGICSGTCYRLNYCQDNGFEEETEWIIRKLTSGPMEIDVISIVGMPRLGKTTLAYKVYNDKSVVDHFDVRAWCAVNQESNEKKLLQKILNQIHGLEESDSEYEIDDDVANKL
ncbi:hypothetical protein T459_14998 [Capsicum annuum]|uniref:NB-ARC domain-containing protein n=1 Tax=Capsicum annuum TaxID=4072 RepID=A0A2G2ZJ21_CAPAN|nr:hypothetical protein T459_14998 [Capsicum annuum]